MTGKEAKEQLKKQYKRQNEYIKKNFDRISVTLPVGTKKKIIAKGESINGYITRIVLEDLDRLEQEQEKCQPKQEQSVKMPEIERKTTKSKDATEDWAALQAEINARKAMNQGKKETQEREKKANQQNNEPF